VPLVAQLAYESEEEHALACCFQALTDERIGASRRRSDITDFFQAALISSLMLLGGNGRLGTADDVFAPTDETVAQIRDRVLLSVRPSTASQSLTTARG
jgi:hypothetical protein